MGRTRNGGEGRGRERNIIEGREGSLAGREREGEGGRKGRRTTHTRYSVLSSTLVSAQRAVCVALPAAGCVCELSRVCCFRDTMEKTLLIFLLMVGFTAGLSFSPEAQMNGSLGGMDILAWLPGRLWEQVAPSRAGGKNLNGKMLFIFPPHIRMIRISPLSKRSDCEKTRGVGGVRVH